MLEHSKKGPLCDLITRHVSFDFDAFIERTRPEDYDHWGGYCLPFAYSDAAQEYHAMRHGCGLFDASPMKKYRLKGRDAGTFLDKLLTAPVSTQPTTKAIYSLMCNDDGYLLDDGMMFKLAEDDYLFLITDIDHDAYFASLNTYDDLIITEETSSLLGLALQGPKSSAMLNAFGFEAIAELKPFDLHVYDLDGYDILIGRVGFTGDLGYEMWFPHGALPAVEKALTSAENAIGVKGIGYGLITAQMGRIEAGMIVPGWDTAGTFEDAELERTPLELTLGWNTKLGRGYNFVGESALTKQKTQGPRYRMEGLRIREDTPIEEGTDLYIDIEGERTKIGRIPSLIWHVKDQCWLGFASLKTSAAPTTAVYALTGNRPVMAELTKLPFIQLDRRSEVPAPL